MTELKDPRARPFAEKMLRANPRVRIGEVKAAATTRGIEVSEHQFYMAARRLGIDRRREFRPNARASGYVSPDECAERLVDALRESRRERERYRAALEKIRNVVADALSGPGRSRSPEPQAYAQIPG